MKSTYLSVSQEEKKDPESIPLESKINETVLLEKAFTKKQVMKVMGLTSIFAVLIGCLIGTAFATTFFPISSGNELSCSESELEKLDLEKQDLPAPSTKHWIFAELSAQEVRAVAAKAVTLLPGDVQTSMKGVYDASVDYISGTSAVELIAPPKKDARAFLEGDDDAVPPPRYAKVTVVRGSATPPDVMEYKIGPIYGCNLGNCGSSSLISVGDDIVPLTKPGKIPWAKRPVDFGDSSLTPLITVSLQDLAPMLYGKFGPVFEFGSDCVPDCPAHDKNAGSIVPFAFNDILSTSTNRISKMLFFWSREDGYADAIWLHPLPFSFHIDQKNGGDSDTWQAYDFILCDQGPFNSTDALLEAYHNSPTTFDCGLGDIKEEDGYRGAWDVPGAPLGSTGRAKAKNSMAARMVSSPGQTFRWKSSYGGATKASGRFVQWQDWSFFFTVRPSTGLAILDVNFKDKLIGHEMALSEAMAAYSGSVDNGDQVFYLDAGYSMSQLGGALVKGVDCPFDAEYPEDIASLHVFPDVNTKLLDSDVSHAIGAASTCIFEDDQADSLWRHTTLNTKKSDGVRNVNLVVRHVTTVGNYDYITEFRFGLDGSIKIGFNFAGFCETRWYDALKTPQEGPRPNGSLSEVVKSNLVAPLHSHFGVFKLDLDVLGSSNTFEVIEAKVGHIPDVKGSDKYPTKYLDTTHVLEEKVGQSTKIVNPTKPALWRFVNRNVSPPGGGNMNAESRAPGYAIMPGATVINTLPDYHPFVLSAAFSKYNLVVTKHHDNEPRCTSVYDLYGSAEPTVSIDDFIDGESIEDTDIVAWVSVGKEHITRTEDVPLISSSFGVEVTLLPWNIFDGHPGMDIPKETTPSDCTTSL